MNKFQYSASINQPVLLLKLRNRCLCLIPVNHHRVDQTPNAKLPMIDLLAHACKNLSDHPRIAGTNVSATANARTKWPASIKSVAIRVLMPAALMPFVMLLVIRRCARVPPVILAIHLHNVLLNNVREFLKIYIFKNLKSQIYFSFYFYGSISMDPFHLFEKKITKLIMDYYYEIIIHQIRFLSRMDHLIAILFSF